MTDVPCLCQLDGRYQRGRCQKCVFMYRIEGAIKRLSTAPKIYGVVTGDDSRDYFFLPSFMRTKTEFFRVNEGMRVEFDSLMTENGYRALDMVVLWLSLSKELHSGESASSKG